MGNGFKRGALIVIEGVDRSGKSTQCSRLVDALSMRHNVPAEMRKFPDRSTPVGQMIDGYLKGQNKVDPRTIHQLFAANRSELMPSMRKDLTDGKTLVLDRYAFSGVAYTVAKGLPGLDIRWCKSIDSGLIEPDLVIFLDIPPQSASQRENFGQERYENVNFQTAVRSAFHQLKEDSWHVVDATQDMDTISNSILKRVLDTVAKAESRPLGELWKDL
ncbi:hypothetical protein HDU76_005536 [Blyttiomyces sp. JEL0837]|nr:hypothetical protein HDU76_005536 [Blyttiomyces sp. JEL0837]